jgi:hypothetical protein
MYKDIPWVLATGGASGQVAVWDTEEDPEVYGHFKGQLSDEAKKLKKKADKGVGADDDMAVVDATGDSSGFEDVDSDEDVIQAKKKSKSGDKKSKKPKA